MLLRTGSRAVTAEDYEHLAHEAAPDVARVRCVAAGEGAEAGGVRVLVVPAVPEDERLRFESLIPPESLVRTIAEHLDRRRVIGARVVVEPPAYQGVTIVAKVRRGADGRPEPRAARVARARSTATSIRSSAARTATAGPSAARCTRATSTPCCSACAASSSSRTCGCSPPIR